MFIRTLHDREREDRDRPLEVPLNRKKFARVIPIGKLQPNDVRGEVGHGSKLHSRLRKSTASANLL
jgi:hypothetical protein